MRRIRIDLDATGLAGAERAIAERLLVMRGPDKGCLRASKPPMREDDPDSGIAAYVWRMVVFAVSDVPAHQCMPVCADFDLPGRYGTSERDEAREIGDCIEKAVVNSIPKQEWAGVQRWGLAYGMIGEPYYDAEGAVKYRLAA